MKNKQKVKQIRRLRRESRTRSKVRGTAERPRLCVKRSLKHIYAQIIDDNTGNTLVAVSDVAKTFVAHKDVPSDITGKRIVAYAVGVTIGQQALERKVTQVVFDRGGYLYHGRVKALADGARAAGLQF